MLLQLTLGSSLHWHSLRCNAQSDSEALHPLKQDFAFPRHTQTHNITHNITHNTQLHGYEPLRAALHGLTARLQAPPGPFQVTVTCGSTYALDVVLDLLLERGDPLLLEEYTYSHALEAQLMPKG